MNLFTNPSVRYLVAAFTVVTISLFPLTGCSKSAEGLTSDTVNIDVPPIYVAQTLVLKEAGEPVVERNYRQLLKACREAHMATVPLSEDDVKKLGRTYYQLWFDAKHSAWQEDTWDFGAGEDLNGACQFHMKHKAGKVIDSAGAHLSIDLTAGVATREANPGFTPGGHEGLDDDQLTPYAKDAGFQRLGYATDAGQRCLRWRLPKPSGVESCTWSEGRQWGFGRGDGSSQASGAYDAGLIVLWVHPANGTGGELTTQRMSVGGKPIDDAVFAAPAGLTFKKGGA